jgi:hypothetical protein
MLHAGQEDPGKKGSLSWVAYPGPGAVYNTKEKDRERVTCIGLRIGKRYRVGHFSEIKGACIPIPNSRQPTS